MSMDAQRDTRLARPSWRWLLSYAVSASFGLVSGGTQPCFASEPPVAHTVDVFGDVEVELESILQQADRLAPRFVRASSTLPTSEVGELRVASNETENRSRPSIPSIGSLQSPELGAARNPTSDVPFRPRPVASPDVADSEEIEVPTSGGSTDGQNATQPAARAAPHRSGARVEQHPTGVDNFESLGGSDSDGATTIPHVAAKVARPTQPTQRPTPTADEHPSYADSSPDDLTAMPSSVRLLRQPIEQALQIHSRQRLNSADNSCWSMMHAFLGWGASTEIHVGGPRGQRVNAIQWIANNQPCANRQLFQLNGERIQGREGPGYQGHPAQFLAMVAQCQVDASLPMVVNGRRFHLSDLIEEEKRTCALGTELTFKLLGLAYYLSTTEHWVCDQGQTWSVEHLLTDELSQPVNGVACGGTHRLMAISFAIAKRRSEGLTMDGAWASAERYISDYHRYALTLTNRDGSFSSDWFRQRSDRGDLDRRIQTTGHILEWLVFSMPEDALYDHRISRAVNFLSSSLAQHRHHEWEVGPKGHAIRALLLYHQRVFQRRPLSLSPIARGLGATPEARR